MLFKASFVTFFFVLFCFFVFCLLGLRLWHMEVPSLGGESDHSSRQRQILNPEQGQGSNLNPHACSSGLIITELRRELCMLFFFFFPYFFFFFPTLQQGDQVILTRIHYNYIFPPPFLLLHHEYLDKVFNAIQQDLLANLF